MEDSIETLRNKMEKREELWAALRSRWFGKIHPLDHLIPSQYEGLLGEIRDNIRDTNDLLLYVRLNGFITIDEKCPSIRTPLYYSPCPHFTYSIPSNLYADNEQYDYEDSCIFSPSFPMRLSHGEDVVEVRPGHLLHWTYKKKNREEWTIDGGGRHITVIASSLSIREPTTSYDLILPLGVIAKDVTTKDTSPNIGKVGNGIVSWTPMKVSAMRGALQVVIEWKEIKSSSFPITLHQPMTVMSEDCDLINYLLLEDIQSIITLDVACRRIEAVMWEGRQIMYRPLLHRLIKEREYLTRLKGSLDRDALLRDSSAVRMGENEYRQWEEVKRYWKNKK